MAADTTKKHFIRIRGANVNNLKNLSVDIQRQVCGIYRTEWLR